MSPYLFGAAVFWLSYAFITHSRLSALVGWVCLVLAIFVHELPLWWRIRDAGPELDRERLP